MERHETFALSADAADADRQVPVAGRDCHLLRYRIQPGSDLYVVTVGTFGVSSASYYWCVSCSTARTCKMLVADDCHLGGPSQRAASLSFFLIIALFVVCHCLGLRLRAATR